jgi:hypothetical protein
LRHALLEGGKESTPNYAFDIQVSAATEDFNGPSDDCFGLCIRRRSLFDSIVGLSRNDCWQSTSEQRYTN